MNIIKRTNYPLMFDEFFNDFFNVKEMNIPPYNIMESDDNFQIEFSVPGSNKKDFQIEEQIFYVISILYFITFITSAFISNAAVAIILCPLAILLSNYFQSLDPSFLVDPTRAFLMAICFGASASFMTPIGYQTNLMVFAPGQYKFKDFMIAGFPITIIFWIVASYCIPIFWPFVK